MGDVYLFKSWSQSMEAKKAIFLMSAASSAPDPNPSAGFLCNNYPIII